MLPVRHYASTSRGRRIHYRRLGEGPPLVMLHSSPSSSQGLVPRMLQLARGHTCIAIDTPGYGESEGLAADQPTIADYADALCETLDALGLPVVDLYGTHTGATIALDFAVRHRKRVRRLVLDGVAVYSEEEKARHRAHYTPSLAPQDYGEHLLRYWNMRRDMAMFSPWYARRPENRLRRPLPTPEQLHQSVVDFLRAGEEYWKGYHAVFRYDTAAALAQLAVPTLITAAPTDTLSRHIERAVGLSERIVTVPASEDSQERILEFLAGEPLPDAPPPVVSSSPPGVPRREYVATSIGQLLLRRAEGGPRRPLVLLHAMPGSSAYHERLMPDLAKDRPVLTFDLPGNGDSAPLPGEPEIGDFARVMWEALDALGVDACDLYGAHTGALIGMEMAIARPQRVRHLLLDGITLFTPEQTAEYLARYCPPLVPTAEGTHLIWAWNFRRDMLLWWPWYDHSVEGLRLEGSVPSAAALHSGFVEFIKGGLTYHLAYRAAFAYPTRERLPLVPVPMLHLCSEVDPLRACVPEARRLTPQTTSRIHRGTGTPEAMAETLALWRAFLDDEPLPPGPEF
ncbi:MAG: alpha/beta fold hydrolase [Chloroflexota bacterium]|nr:alpha/beta fold hydrolase [Dehalococcoidia bacterium]MDW8254895.1 alpha/beta fold hydrolase [Chloroflexota bacterium]